MEVNGNVLETFLGPQGSAHSPRVLTATAESVAPAGDQAGGAGGCAAGGQRNGLDSTVELGWGGQLDEHDVIVQGVAAVARVADDFSRVDELLGGFGEFQVVFPKLHLDATGKEKAWCVLYCYWQLERNLPITECTRSNITATEAFWGRGCFLSCREPWGSTPCTGGEFLQACKCMPSIKYRAALYSNILGQGKLL